MQECGLKDARRFDINVIAADLHEWLGKIFACMPAHSNWGSRLRKRPPPSSLGHVEAGS